MLPETDRDIQDSLSQASRPYFKIYYFETGIAGSCRGLTGNLPIHESVTSAVLVVIANTAHTAAGPGYAGSHAIGSELAVARQAGIAYVPIRNVGPSEVILLVNR